MKGDRYMIKWNTRIIIESWMRTLLNLDGPELEIYAMIYGFSQTENGKFYGSLKYIMEWTGKTKPTVITALKNLENKKLITKNDVLINNIRMCEYASVPVKFVDFFPDNITDEERILLKKLGRTDIINLYKNQVNTVVSAEESEEDQLKNLTGTSKKFLPVPVKKFNRGGKKILPNIIDNNIDNIINKKRESTTIKSSSRTPSVDEVKKYCSERNNKIDPENFFDYYQMKGWPKDWKAAIRRWERFNYETNTRKGKSRNKFNEFSQNDYDFDKLEKLITDN